jgi:transglutaminase-like putative cysteine protease
MPERYKFLTALTAVAGSLSLIATGEPNPVYYPFLLLMLYGYWRLLKGKPQGSRFVIGASSIGGLIIFLVDVFIVTGDYLLSVAHLSFIFHAIKSFDIKEPYDPFQVYFMALLQLVVASEFTVAMLFGGIIILFIILFIFVMNMAHYIKERVEPSIPLKTVGLLIGASVVISIIFFISLPRLKYGLWGKSHIKGIKNAGFSERMDLSSGDLKLDPTVVARVEVRPVPEGPLYWKGNVLDYFDGETWSNTLQDTKRNLFRIDNQFLIQEGTGGMGSETTITSPSIVEQDVLLEPLESEIIFSLERPVSVITSLNRVEIDASGTMYIPRKGARRIHYKVISKRERQRSEVGSQNLRKILPQSLNSELRPPSSELRFYLQIPENIREPIRKFTEGLLRGTVGGEVTVGSEGTVALAIERYLKENYIYSLNPGLPEKGFDPVTYFLFRSKKGYCEHFSSAMVLMLRSQGIPARIATGFLGGELNPLGNYVIIRQKDAHSWVEAWIDGSWKRFDPTPPQIGQEKKPSLLLLYLDYMKMKWQRYVVNFSREDQFELLKGMSEAGYKLHAIGRRLNNWLKAQGLNLTFKLRGGKGELALRAIALLLSCSAFLLFYWFIKRRSRKLSMPGFYYLKLRKVLEKRGYRITSSTTSGEVLKIAITAGLNRDTVKEFIELYNQARFGGRPVDTDRLRRLLKASTVTCATKLEASK